MHLLTLGAHAPEGYGSLCTRARARVCVCVCLLSHISPLWGFCSSWKRCHVLSGKRRSKYLWRFLWNPSVAKIHTLMLAMPDPFPWGQTTLYLLPGLWSCYIADSAEWKAHGKHVNETLCWLASCHQLAYAPFPLLKGKVWEPETSPIT